MIITREISSSASQQLVDGTYRNFIESIWGIVTDAYTETFEKHNQLNNNWEEAAYTANLAYFMREIQQKKEFPWYINTNDEVYDQSILDGKTRPQKAKKIDITVTMIMAPDLYFAIECKLVGETRFSKRKGLQREYVENGMKRFIVDETYASKLPEGGMIGFVVVGSSDNIVGEINSVISKKLSNIDCLSKQPNAGNDHEVFISTHLCRKTNKELTLRHVFLNF